MITFFSRAAVALSAGLALSACSLTTSEEGGQAASLSPASTVAPDADPVPQIEVPEIWAFKGKTDADLIRHFGEPDLVRHEGPAIFQHYKVNAMRGPCVLIAVLYEERGSLQPLVRHLSVREGRNAAPDAKACLKRLAYAQRFRRAS